MMGANNLFKSATEQLKAAASEKSSSQTGQMTRKWLQEPFDHSGHHKAAARVVNGWVPELEQHVETKAPRRSFASRPAGASRRASPVAFSTMIHGGGARVADSTSLVKLADLTSLAVRAEEGPGCNPAGNAIVCGGKYEF